MRKQKSTADLFIELCRRDGIEAYRVLPPDLAKPRKRRAKQASGNGKLGSSHSARGRG